MPLVVRVVRVMVGLLLVVGVRRLPVVPPSAAAATRVLRPLVLGGRGRRVAAGPLVGLRGLFGVRVGLLATLMVVVVAAAPPVMLLLLGPMVARLVVVH